MPGGRPAQTERTAFGERLFQFREQKGLSQKEMAQKIGITQQAYAVWERKPTALKPEQLTTVATLLETSLDDLFGLESKTRTKGGPVGKLQRTLEEASKLSRHEQNKIAEVIEGMLMLHEAKAS